MTVSEAGCFSPVLLSCSVSSRLVALCMSWNSVWSLLLLAIWPPFPTDEQQVWTSGYGSLCCCHSSWVSVLFVWFFPASVLFLFFTLPSWRCTQSVFCPILSTLLGSKGQEGINLSTIHPTICGSSEKETDLVGGQGLLKAFAGLCTESSSELGVHHKSVNKVCKLEGPSFSLLFSLLNVGHLLVRLSN